MNWSKKSTAVGLNKDFWSFVISTSRWLEVVMSHFYQFYYETQLVMCWKSSFWTFLLQEWFMYLVARCDGFHEKKTSIWVESIFASVLFDDPSSERMITDGSIVIVRKHHRNLNTSSRLENVARYKTFLLKLNNA